VAAAGACVQRRPALLWHCVLSVSPAECAVEAGVVREGTNAGAGVAGPRPSNVVDADAGADAGAAGGADGSGADLVMFGADDVARAAALFRLAGGGGGALFVPAPPEAPEATEAPDGTEAAGASASAPPGAPPAATPAPGAAPASAAAPASQMAELAAPAAAARVALTAAADDADFDVAGAFAALADAF
jgi:hypothetical protein